MTWSYISLISKQLTFKERKLMDVFKKGGGIEFQNELLRVKIKKLFKAIYINKWQLQRLVTSISFFSLILIFLFVYNFFLAYFVISRSEKKKQKNHLILFLFNFSFKSMFTLWLIVAWKFTYTNPLSPSGYE